MAEPCAVIHQPSTIDTFHRCNAPVTAPQGSLPSNSVDWISDIPKGRQTAMNRQFDIKQRLTRTGVAVLAAGVLMTGAAWHGFAADQPTAKATAATVTTPITHAIAGGRDSYADIVDVAAPAVVTIRTTGKARVSPTQFDGQDPEDLLRRFFGDQFPGQPGQ